MPRHPVTLAGLPLPNPIGLAGGFDKNAEYIDHLFALGFGFIEVGTVTPRPQAGNPKPRLFRLPKARALINRMGFNNNGLDCLIENLKNRKVPGVVGVNIGKNKDTPLADAHIDYGLCMDAVYEFADYITVNISSPNTPGLRELHGEKYLDHLLCFLNEKRVKLEQQFHKRLPLLVKISVDIPNEELPAIVKSVMDSQFDGIITSNTTIEKQSVVPLKSSNEQGGLSGAPLTTRAQQQLMLLRKLTGTALALVGVGGIVNPHNAIDRLESGANALQIYTGLIYQGPGVVKEILKALAAR